MHPKHDDSVDDLMDQWSQEQPKHVPSRHSPPPPPKKPPPPPDLGTADPINRDAATTKKSGLLPLAIAAICGMAVGVLLGLGVASIGGKSLAEVTAERDQAIAEKTRLESGWKEVEKKAVDVKNTFLEFQEANEEELANLKKTGEEISGHWLKSQALIYMMRENELFLGLIRTEPFRRKFKADWYTPDAAFKLIGGRWFAEEQVQCGVVDQSILENTRDEPRQSGGYSANAIDKWEVVKSWRINGSKTTETFRIGTSSWRIRWEAGDQIGFGVYQPGDQLVAHGSSEKSDWSIVHHGPGIYYLELDSVGHAVFFVEESRGPN